MVNGEAKSTYVEQIKANQFQDKKLNALKNNVLHGEVAYTTLNASGIVV